MLSILTDSLGRNDDEDYKSCVPSATRAGSEYEPRSARYRASASAGVRGWA